VNCGVQHVESLAKLGAQALGIPVIIIMLGIDTSTARACLKSGSLYIYKRQQGMQRLGRWRGQTFMHATTPIRRSTLVGSHQLPVFRLRVGAS
jgi:hypothetical protein